MTDAKGQSDLFRDTPSCHICKTCGRGFYARIANISHQWTRKFWLSKLPDVMVIFEYEGRKTTTVSFEKGDASRTVVIGQQCRACGEACVCLCRKHRWQSKQSLLVVFAQLFQFLSVPGGQQNEKRVLELRSILTNSYQWGITLQPYLDIDSSWTIDILFLFFYFCSLWFKFCNHGQSHAFKTL